MTTAAVPERGSFQGLSDLRLIGRQVRYEQLSFWLNPIGAFFTIVFSTIFLLILEATAGKQTVGYLSNIKLIQYYVPAFVAYGIMSACYNILAIQLVNRREFGLLKRLRLSPVPTWILMSAIFISSMLIALLELIMMLALGRFGYSVHGPSHIAAFAVMVVIGMFSFTALAMGVSTLVPNADAAGPVSSIVFFILLAFSGLWFPIPNNSVLAHVTSYFPVRHLISGLETSFNNIPGASPWNTHDLLVMVLWGVAGVVLALRRWQWSPRRA